MDRSTLQKLRVPELRQALRERGLSATGNKPELISRLIEADTQTNTHADSKVDAVSDVSDDAPVDAHAADVANVASDDRVPLELPTVGSHETENAGKDGRSSEKRGSSRGENGDGAQVAHAADVATVSSSESKVPLETAAVGSHEVGNVGKNDRRSEKRGPSAGENGDGGGGVDVEDYYEDALARVPKRPRVGDVRSCPYLDTVNRALLDFDYEKQCSVTLATRNVYACLVCGKYFQGRAEGTPAMDHSLQVDHHVFMHLGNGALAQQGRVYCLPENYEVDDPSLADIRFLLDPTYTAAQIAAFDQPLVTDSEERLDQAGSTAEAGDSVDVSFRRFALDGTPFVPGIPGLNPLDKTDFATCVVQALARVVPFRNWLLVKENTAPIEPSAAAASQFASLQTKAILSAPGIQNTSDLVSCTGALFRRMFNPRAFRHHVSPHELLLAVGRTSAGRFRIGNAGDPNEFVTFLLATLNAQIMQRFKVMGLRTPTIVQQVFRGHVRIRERKALTNAAQAEQLQKQQYNWVQKLVPFFVLTLDIPPPPVFRNPLEAEKQIVLQTTLTTMLEKFSDERDILDADAHMIRRYILTALPDCLVLNLKRFTKNQWFTEKNPTIVNFPFRDLDMAPFLAPSADLVDSSARAACRYELIAVISHNGTVELGSYSAFVLHRPTGHWFECDDLRVTDVTQDLDKIALSEVCTLIYYRQP